MMKHILTVISAGLIASARDVAAQSNCLPSSSTDSTYSALMFVKGQLVNLVTATDTGTVRVRANLSVPSMAASQVTLVTDPSTCTKAATALAALTTGGTVSQGAWVFALGSQRFVAFNGKQRAAGSAYAVVFDKKWVRLSSFPF